jgi:DNA-binding beta-propeller fold protein YncE
VVGTALITKVSTSSRGAICASIAAALLAACGGSQLPIGAPGAMLQTSAIATHAAHGKSWMAPEAKSKDLLYVGDIYDVTIYSYPQGKLEGRLNGFYEIGGECVDAKGDVFVVNTLGGKIVEYAHGGKKPIQTLQAPGYEPADCAIDPTTRNLAVTIFGGASRGELAIYQDAKGTPTLYTDPDFLNYGYCGYDDNGNLFIDGGNEDHAVVFAELRKGSSSLLNLTLDQSFNDTGAIQWDGKYLAVGNQNTSNIYRFSISGSQGTEVGVTQLGGDAHWVHKFFILDHKVIAPNFYFIGSRFESNVLIFDYPAGGSPLKTISKGVKASEAAVVSKAQK